jgi:hypothetical protein
MTAFPKPRPHALVKAKRKVELAKQDREENAKVWTRSGGICEAIEAHPNPWSDRSWTLKRCSKPATRPSHHLIYGSGRRNVGESVLAAHRLAVCRTCHKEITQHILVPAASCDRERAASVRYERIR